MSSSEHSDGRRDERGGGGAGERSCYDVLDVKPGATREEIEAAYRRALRIIEGNSLGGYLMLEPEARESAKREVERAFEVLTNQKERARESERAGETPKAPQRELQGGSQSDKGGRRARRRRKRDAARRARAERGSESTTPGAADAPTLPAQAAFDDDVDAEAVTVITSAEAEPILDDAPAPEASEQPSSPPRKKPLLRFLSPVVEAAPEPPPARATQPLPAPTTRPPAPAAATAPPTTESQPPTSRRPWLYSDAGAETVTEPRVITRAEDEDDDHLTLPPESEINGGVIRRLREARGITLAELAEQTHIRKDYLKAIEEQNLEELPARVYLRGFLTQIARVLKVDKKRLAEGYMSFVGRFRK